MADWLVPTLSFAGLLMAVAAYYLLVRRRGRDRHLRRAEFWDRAMSQARAIQRLRHLEERDRGEPQD